MIGVGYEYMGLDECVLEVGFAHFICCVCV